MNVNVEIEIIEDLPIKKIEEYADLVVYGVARKTLDYTYADNRFPKKTGNLERSSMAQPVRKEQQYTYCLDVPQQAEYAKYVWVMPQDTTNWTNPDTYAEWYVTTYKNKKDVITSIAVNDAIRSVR